MSFQKPILFLGTVLLIGAEAFAQEDTPESHSNRKINPLMVHDPVMIKQDSTYYVFGTGDGISTKSSKDRIHWTPGNRVFKAPLAWWKKDIPTQDGNIWAPDIHYRDGIFHLYYSVSAWMDFNSSIGYATNVTLDPNDPNYKWVDHGKVIDFHNGGIGVNCIDPNVFVDKDGRVWLFYGSYKAGLRVTELNAKTGKLLNEEHPKIYTLTTSLGEGVFVIQQGEYYYIFASRDICCRGIDSNYNVVMGRSKKLTGPYLNKEGKSWEENSCSQFMRGDYEEPGRGHNGFFTENDTTFIVYHAYTRSENGTPLLRIKPVFMDADGWPTLENTGTPINAKQAGIQCIHKEK